MILIINRIFFFILSITIISSCKKKEEVFKEEPQVTMPFKSRFVTSALSETDQFTAKGTSLGIVALKEVSGLALSKVNDNSLWAHNDAGNEKILYLLDKNTGATKAGYFLNGTTNLDWEDIEVGPGPVDGKTYVYLADIGDNNQVYEKRTIYRFEEPAYEPAHNGMIVGWTGTFDVLNFTFPEGPKDSETLLLDHETKDLYVLTKRDLPARLYIYPYPQETGNITQLTLAGTLPIFAPVAGNVSSEGNEILIKNYNSVFYWKHEMGKPLWNTLAKEPFVAPYNPVEPQGEAIGFDSSGGYYTLSEMIGNDDVHLYFYGRIK
ncbi:MAG: hypothetical protein M3512_02045 [Bacteroidota bacterium]|nr:hypothetical protein [Bacteroidota bacterium]